MMVPSLLGSAAALLSLCTHTQAIPQGAPGNGQPLASSTLQAGTTSTWASAGSSGTANTVSNAPAATGTTACNNSPDLCNRNYNNITHLGAHDAGFLRDSSTSFSTSGNQFYNATKALSAGIRLLQAQVHNKAGVLQLCHSSCSLLDAGTLEAWLADIKYWMDNNPNDVVSILLVNSDSNSTSAYGSAFTSSGISTYGYTPTSTTAISQWPTLQTLITANTRLVTFITNIDYSTTYPYLLPEFNYIFETAYGQTDADQFVCTLDRPSSLTSAASAISSGYMPLINHFRYTEQAFSIEIPDITNITTTNSDSTTLAGSLGLQGATCTSEWGIKPTFMLVDFWNVGPAISTADNLNGITAEGRTSFSTALLTADSGARALGTNMWVLATAAGVVGLVNTILL